MIHTAEQSRSAARDLGIIHTDRFYRESAALLSSPLSGSLPPDVFFPEPITDSPLAILATNVDIKRRHRELADEPVAVVSLGVKLRLSFV
jgi:hypothetical protein